MRIARYCFVAVVASFVVSCDHKDSLAPAFEARSSSSGTTISAPSGANAVAGSNNRIDLTWVDNSSNESGFEVHRSTTGATGPFTLLSATRAGLTSYSDGGLAGTTEYCYKIRAFRTIGSKTGYSEFSTAACARTLAPPTPTAPAGTDAMPLGSATVAVGWGGSSTNVDGFRVERSVDGGASWTIAGTHGPNDPSFYFYDSGLTSEQQVCYRVIAYNVGGDSPPSNTDCTTPPAAPTNLTFTWGADGVTFDLAWTDNSAVEDGYEVSVCGDPFCSRLALLAADATDYHYDGGDYFSGNMFVVLATKDGGNSTAAILTLGSTGSGTASAHSTPSAKTHP